MPGKIILGELGDIEAGVRQLIRPRPLETIEVVLPDGGRVRAFLIVRRNQTRDYLDVAALADRMGVADAAHTLVRIDAYYADQHHGGDGVATQVTRQLADPRPQDRRTTRELLRYRRLDPRWHDWSAVVAVCRAVALGMA